MFPVHPERWGTLPGRAGPFTRFAPICSRRMARSSESFTPKAKRCWDALSSRERTTLLSNAWCSRCKVVTTIVGIAGRIKDGNLILEGKCSRCGSAVGRLVEGE